MASLPCDTARRTGYPRRLPDRSSDETWHDGYAHAAAGHDEYLDEFAFPFKILRHHQGGTIPGHAHADTWKIRYCHVTERDATGRTTYGLGARSSSR